MKNIAIIAYEDCWAVSVFLAKDFFTIVSLLDSHYSLPQTYYIEIITTDGAPITSSSNSLVVADNSLSDKSYLKMGNIYTTGSFEAGISVLLGIVAKDKGDRFSQQCATHLLISDSGKLNLILPQFNNHKDEKINEIQDWIHSHSSSLITINDLAKQFNFSERNLKRRFTQATGISINRYVQEVRIDRAKKQLLATDKTVNEISEEVGYENSSFFSRLFKKSTGLTPAKWRKNDLVT